MDRRRLRLRRVGRTAESPQRLERQGQRAGVDPLRSADQAVEPLRLRLEIWLERSSWAALMSSANVAHRGRVVIRCAEK